MTKQIKLERFQIITTVTDTVEVRMDWSNDRHHHLSMGNLTPSGVTEALELLVYLIKQDIAMGEL